jgi:hypothetical protein
MGKKKEVEKRPNIVITGEILEEIVAGGGLNLVVNRAFTPKISYWLAKILNKVNSEWKVYIEARKPVIERFARKDEAGNPLFKDEARTQYDIPAEDRKEFNEALQEIQKEEIDLGIPQLERTMEQMVEDLKEAEEKIKPIEMTILMYFTRE